jgi:hypothetical protein
MIIRSHDNADWIARIEALEQQMTRIVNNNSIVTLLSNEARDQAEKTPEPGVNGDKPAAEALAKEAHALYLQGLSYHQIAERWEQEGKPTLKGGKWHKGTVAKMIQRHGCVA